MKTCSALSAMVTALLLTGCVCASLEGEEARELFLIGLGTLDENSSLCIVRISSPVSTSDRSDPSMTAVNVDLSQWKESSMDGESRPAWTLSLTASDIGERTKTMRADGPSQMRYSFSFFREVGPYRTKAFDFALFPMDGPFVCHVPTGSGNFGIEIEGHHMKTLFCLTGTKKGTRAPLRYLVCSWDGNRATGIQVVDNMIKTGILDLTARFDSLVTEQAIDLKTKHEKSY